MSFKFSAKERLKSRKTIAAVFKVKRSAGAFPVRFFFMLNTNQAAATVEAGFSVSKKNFKKAVDRNRLKRLMREAYRFEKENLCKELDSKGIKLAGMWVYVGNELCSFKDIQKAMRKSVDRILYELSQK